MKLLILKNTLRDATAAPGLEVVSYDTVKNWVLSKSILSHVARYESVELRTYRLSLTSKPLLTAVVVRALSRGASTIEDDAGEVRKVTLGYVARLAVSSVRDAFAGSSLRRSTARRLENLSSSGARLAPGIPVYLRTDLAFAVRSGGSVGHVAGVVNNLGISWAAPIFVSSDAIPTVGTAVEVHVVVPSDRHRDNGEMWALWYSEQLRRDVDAIVAGRPIAFAYQRYSLNNYCGLQLAAESGVPFVLEYNGSEVWMARNWGRALKYEALAEQIELANLTGADLVVVVSSAMRDELVARGIDADKILVNPNGVDPDRYSPEIDGSALRARLGLEGKVVVGFIGTFGRWHGAEVLAESFGRLLDSHPEYSDRLRLLMVGDGATMAETREAVAAHRIEDVVIFAGMVPQEEGPEYLAACDILASPHVPNADGTPFFGSPTKLFEYMAMGKSIVASDLDQIGEVLEHDRTAWLVKPGDVDALAAGIRVLADDDALRARLGGAARVTVVAKYTWLEHTRRIVDALKERCG